MFGRIGGAVGCAVQNGAVKCWGFNYGGRVGDGTTTQRNAPVQVSGLTSGVTQVYNGGDVNCALLDTGALKCWGQGSILTTYVNSTVPVDVIYSAGSGVNRLVRTGGYSSKLTVGFADGTVGGAPADLPGTPTDVGGGGPSLCYRIGSSWYCYGSFLSGNTNFNDHYSTPVAATNVGYNSSVSSMITITVTSGGQAASASITLTGRPSAGKRIADFLDAANSYGSSPSDAQVRIVARSGVAVLQRFSSSDADLVLQELILNDVTLTEALDSLDGYQGGLGRSPTTLDGVRFYSAGPLTQGASVPALRVG